MTAASVVLATRCVTAGYDGQPVLHDVDLHVGAGEVVAVIGPNGAGKSTLLRTMAGVLRPQAGSIEWLGTVTRAPLHRRAIKGLAYQPERTAVFAHLTAGQNLRAARCRRSAAVGLFPELGEHLRTRAGLLTADQRATLILARALARRPRAVLVDELCAGLAPTVTDRLLAAVRTAADGGAGVMIVDQYVRKALAIADRVYVLRHGRVEFEGTAEQARRRIADLEAGYLTAR